MFEYLNSSQTARAIQIALVAVAAMLITSAQFRVLAGPPSRVRYAVAWLVGSVVLGALGAYLDTMVGLTAIGDRVLNFVGAAVHVLVGLAVGHWWTRRPSWPTYSRLVAWISLFVIQVMIAMAALSLR
ncbi:MAG: hypothetical protein WD801_03935 [Gemmatimonadaceae bacterium]